MNIAAKLVNKYTLVGLLILAVFAYFSGKSEGYDNGFTKAKADCLQQQHQAVARAIEQTNRINEENAQIAAAAYQQELAKKPKIQTIEKRIIQYATNHSPGHCDLDDSELHILADLTRTINGSTETADPAKSVSSVPTATGTQ